MDDALKPEKIKLIDAEQPSPPPPSSAAEAAAYCATVISNVEGRRHRAIPKTREGRRVTIEQLDVRLRRMEDQSGIGPPPPMDTPSWDSLTWRAARLYRKMPMGPPLPARLASCPVPPIAPTMALLRSTLSALGIGEPVDYFTWEGLFEHENGGAKAVDEDEGEGEKELLRTAAQFLTNYAGRRGFKVLCSFELRDVCKLALNLSLEQDGNGVYNYGPGPGIPGQGGFPIFRSPGTRAAPWPPTLQNLQMRPGGMRNPARTCCGCCDCFCHGGVNNRIVNVPPPILPRAGVMRWISRKYDQEKEERRSRRTGVKAKIAAAFGKLAFWRRGRRDDESDSDTSSISTRTSSTCT